MLAVAGQIKSADVPLLEREVRSVSGPLSLDLSELVLVDEAGIRHLHELASSTVRLDGASGYIRLLLENRGSGRSTAHRSHAGKFG